MKYTQEEIEQARKIIEECGQRQRAIIVATIGGPNWEPTEADYQEIKQLFKGP